MSTVEVTYSDLAQAGIADVSEAEFAACLPHALSVVRSITWPNEPAGADERAAYKRAIIAAIAADAATGSEHGMAVGGFSIGSFSVSGASASKEAEQTDPIRAAAERELIGTGLLYMGVGWL